MAAQIEEVVVELHRFHAEKVFPNCFELQAHFIGEVFGSAAQRHPAPELQPSTPGEAQHSLAQPGKRRFLGRRFRTKYCSKRFAPSSGPIVCGSTARTGALPFVDGSRHLESVFVQAAQRR